MPSVMNYRKLRDVYVNEQIYSCTVCNLHFFNQMHYIEHNNNVHNIVTYQCPTCSIRFLDQDTLHSYIFNQSKKMENLCSNGQRIILPCVECNRTFFSFKLLQRHTRQHYIKCGYSSQINDAKFTCHKCNESFPIVSKVLEHLKNVHNVVLYERDNDKSFRENYAYKCNINGCSEIFYNSKLLRKHIRVHAPEWPMKCLYCNKMIHKWIKYVTHIRVKHKHHEELCCNVCRNFFFRDNINHLLNKVYKCTVCKKEFKTRFHYFQHRIVHSELQAHKCYICDKVYTRTFYFKRHLQQHRKGLKCPLCYKVFCSEDSFEKHEKMHLRQREYLCKICHATFITLKKLNQHILIHKEKSKLHECSLCGKQFPRMNSLKLHERSHKLVKPFICYCGKTFNQAKVLYNHIETHRSIADRLTETE